MARPANSGQTSARPIRLRIDVPLLLVVLTTVVFGLLMLYSASSDFSTNVMGQSSSYLFFRQLMWLGLGLVLAVAATMIDYHFYKRFLLPMVAVMIIALVAVLVVNTGGITRGRTFSAGSIQPSELAKLVTIVYLSFWLYAKQDRLHQVSFGLLPLGLMLGLTGGLIVIQPDISAAATLVLLGLLLFFLAGGEWRQLLLVLIVALVIGALVVAVSDTGRQRITDYYNGLLDPINSSSHIRRSLEAIVKGGVFGVGIGRATTKYAGLPLPPTDSIFAVIAEETGLLGAGFVVLLFVLLVWRGLVIARRAPDKLGALLASGLTMWIAIEALINMGVIAGVLPVAGNVLPFISSGGSNLVASLTAIGIVMNVARQSVDRESDEGRFFSAVVNLRRGNRGRRVSRAHRSSGSRE